MLQGIILTGSRHDAYATDEWNLKLRELINTAHSRQQRILGHCFGCQITNIVLGGTVSTCYKPMQMKLHFAPEYQRQSLILLRYMKQPGQMS